jgi:fumarylacetoacetase
MNLDATHDPDLRSWVESANDPSGDFPIQNLPFGRFRRRAYGGGWRIGVRIGDQILDLALASCFMTSDPGVSASLRMLEGGDLKPFMQLPAANRRAVRSALSEGLRHASPLRFELESCLCPVMDAELTVPCDIRDYTDFYTGIHHATAVGRQFRPDNPLLPNYQWVPIGYHGRASSIVASGTSFRRPAGQIKAAGSEGPPVYRPSQRLDYELELGFLIGKPNALGRPVPIGEAEDHLFGVTLFNDWSARDIQAWEYQPLGPFLSKNFVSTISPWVVTMEALEPFRAPLMRPAGSAELLPYLDSEQTREGGALDITLEVWLQSMAMREKRLPPVRISMSSTAQASFWTPSQLLTHHTSGGCNLQAGDLLGSGTLSGPLPEQAGSLLELSQGGKVPFHLVNGETRAFLEDGDTVTFKAYCERAGMRRIGFGDCTGEVLPTL